MAENENNEEMNDELTAKLIHFHDVTQIEDLERCKTILKQHNWNVELAVQSTFRDSSTTSSNHSLPAAEAHSNMNVGVRRRVQSPPQSLMHHHSVLPRQMIYVGGRRPQPPQGFWGWSYFFFVLPFRYTISQVFSVLRFFFRLFFPDPRERITDPHGDVITFISEFAVEYPNHPNFFRGTYGKAQEEAKKQIRFLLVYLHDPDNEDTQPFCHGALCQPASVEFINENAILWGCSIQKPEGYRVSKVIRNASFPLLAVVCLFQNRMTVVGRLQGRLTAEDLVGKLNEIFEMYEPHLISARADQTARTQNILIRQEQDEAYQLSLQKDQEKMDKKKREEEEEQRLKERKEQLRKEKERKVEIGLERKARCKQELTPEPDDDFHVVLDLVIKFPNGKRLRRKFRGSDTVKTLHDFIYAQDDSPPSFQVFGNFPRRPIPGCCTNTVDLADAETPLLQDVGLGKNDTLFVQALSTDDDDEDSEDASSDGETSR